jgi:hypothetical protein
MFTKGCQISPKTGLLLAGYPAFEMIHTVYRNTHAVYRYRRPHKELKGAHKRPKDKRRALWLLLVAVGSVVEVCQMFPKVFEMFPTVCQTFPE